MLEYIMYSLSSCAGGIITLTRIINPQNPYPFPRRFEILIPLITHSFRPELSGAPVDTTVRTLGTAALRGVIVRLIIIIDLLFVRWVGNPEALPIFVNGINLAQSRHFVLCAYHAVNAMIRILSSILVSGIFRQLCRIHMASSANNNRYDA